MNGEMRILIELYICLFLCLAIPFADMKDKQKTIRNTFLIVIYLIMHYILLHSDLVSALLNRLNAVLYPVIDPGRLWTYFGYLYEGIFQLMLIKVITRYEWSTAAAVSFLLSVFFHASGIIYNLFNYGSGFNKILPLFCQILLHAACVVGMAGWFRKTYIGIKDFSLRDRKRLAVVFGLLFIFECRLSSVFQNTMDIELGLLSVVVPILITVMLSKYVLAEHYEIEQGRLKSFGKTAENELEMMQEYEGLLTKSKHDLLHHLNTIRNFIQLNDHEEVQKYIEQSIQKTTVDSPLRYSDNIYVNAIVRYIKSTKPEININVDSTIGKDCRIDPLDIGLIVLCLLDTPAGTIRNSQKINLVLRQVEKMVIISEAIEETDVISLLNETDLSMLNEVIARYNGSMNTDVKETGDLVILLREK